MFRYDHRLLKEDEVLGGTQTSTVYAYSKYPQDDRWAVKHVHATDLEMMGKYLGEIVLGFSFDHPAILPIKGYHIEEQEKPRAWNIYMKMPRMQGTLSDIIKSYRDNNDYIPRKQIIKYFHSLVSGLDYLHQKKIAHRDIKLTNVLFDKKGDIRLGDIGIGKYIPEGEDMNMLSTRTGTQMYAAPELADMTQSVRKMNIYKADCWSLGLLMLELCTLRHPIRTGSKELIEYIEKELQNVETRYGTVLKNLILCLVQLSPAKRKSMSEVKEILENEFAETLVNGILLKGLIRFRVWLDWQTLYGV